MDEPWKPDEFVGTQKIYLGLGSGSQSCGAHDQIITEELAGRLRVKTVRLGFIGQPTRAERLREYGSFDSACRSLRERLASLRMTSSSIQRTSGGICTGGKTDRAPRLGLILGPGQRYID